jgi:glycosyltransferase 2 family protein
MTRRQLWIAGQLVFVAAVVAFLSYAVRDSWAEAAPRLRDASVTDLALATILLAAYYLLFVVGWRWILRALGVHVSYGIALQAEMASMLAKYIPGGVWTPAARVVWLRKAGISAAAPVVVSSILLEAGLSALAGVGVFVVGLAAIGGADTPLVPVLAFAVLVAILLHPRVFRWIAVRVFRPFGGIELPEIPYRTLLGLLVYYALTWIVGGAALLFLIRAVGGGGGAGAIVFLGGTAAVGAIVAVLSVIAPSGLGVREATMYGLMLAVASPGVALGATVLNRIAITVVEAVLLLAGVLLWRHGRREQEAADAAAA